MSFKETVAAHAGGLLCGRGIETIQVNVGLRCDLACRHCHVESSPIRTEEMSHETMELVLAAVGRAGVGTVDITGGAPELHPHLRWFIESLRALGCGVIVRTNLSVLLLPGIETLPTFFRDHRVELVASLPCYSEQNVDRQRGGGTYEKSIEAIRRLNALGYGVEPAYPLHLVYNPVGATLPPPQAALEADYRRELRERFGISFTRLLTITNMPIGRFRHDLRREGREAGYLDLLRAAFNARTLEGLMCRHQISVGWDGRLYDCDFNLALRMPVNHSGPEHIRAFDAAVLARRRIVTGEHCFGCTAGCGSSCGGALVEGNAE